MKQPRSPVRPALPVLWTLASILAPLLGALPASAQIRTSFRLFQIDGGCWVDGQDPFPTGDPERYFRAGIFDESSLAVLQACASGCFADTDPTTPDGSTLDFCAWDTGCGLWNFADQTLQKVTPDLSGVYFYFGLFDEDTDADDSLGDHWFFSATARTQSDDNNNFSPYYAGNPITFLCSSRDVEGVGDPANFSVSYSTWFEDLSGPVPPGTPTHVDATAPDPYWNDDDTLEFTWTPGSDPNSDVSARTFDLWDATLGAFVFSDVPAPTGHLTICASGCDASYTPVEEHLYWFRARVRNGGAVELQNQVAEVSAWVEVQQRTGVVDAGEVRNNVASFELARPSPNPFSSRVRLEYSLVRESVASVCVYDVRGRRIAELANGVHRGGKHFVTWDGRTADGNRAVSGVYFARLECDAGVRTRRLVLLD